MYVPCPGHPASECTITHHELSILTEDRTPFITLKTHDDGKIRLTVNGVDNEIEPEHSFLPKEGTLYFGHGTNCTTLVKFGEDLMIRMANWADWANQILGFAAPTANPQPEEESVAAT